MKNNKSFAALVVLMFLPFALTSCAALTRYKCNRDYAAKKGMEDAVAGLTSQPAKTEGTACTEGTYTESNYVHDYLAGFAQKKNEVCQKTTASTYGKADGDAGLAAQPQKAKLNLCSDVKGFKGIAAEYDAAFTKSYCSTERATRLGQAQGIAVEADGFDAAFAECKQKGGLKKAYSSAYKGALAAFCTESQAQSLATGLANTKRPKEEGMLKLGRCTDVSHAGLRAVFEKQYDETKSKLEKEEAARVALAAEQARVARANEFQRTTAVSTFTFRQRPHTSRCNVAADKSFVQVEVENPYPEQLLIQGAWKVQYYNGDFAKITEDNTQEAVLVSGNNKKTFQKLTLPRDAAFCRAEYTAPALPVIKL